MVRRYGEVTLGGNRTDEGNGKDRFFAELRSSGGSSSFSKQVNVKSFCACGIFSNAEIFYNFSR